MNRKLKKALKSAFDAPQPTRKAEFLRGLKYPKATVVEFCISQLGFIRKRFWCLSALILLAMATLLANISQGKEIVGALSAILPLLILIGVTELGKSASFNMTELEMSCKYNLHKITLVRLFIIGALDFGILVSSLIIFKNHSQYEVIRYSLYAITPFLISAYLSLWVTNHVKSHDALYICGGVTTFVSMAAFALSLKFTGAYSADYTFAWGAAMIATVVLLAREIYFLLKEGVEKWSFV